MKSSANKKIRMEKFEDNVLTKALDEYCHKKYFSVMTCLKDVKSKDIHVDNQTYKCNENNYMPRYVIEQTIADSDCAGIKFVPKTIIQLIAKYGHDVDECWTNTLEKYSDSLQIPSPERLVTSLMRTYDVTFDGIMNLWIPRTSIYEHFLNNERKEMEILHLSVRKILHVMQRTCWTVHLFYQLDVCFQRASCVIFAGMQYKANINYLHVFRIYFNG